MLERWARPLRGLGNGVANVVAGAYRVLGTPGRYLQDLLNGTWLGHSLHAVVVDVVVGGATAALLLDVLGLVFGVDGLGTAATWVLGLAWLSGVGAILTGLTELKDTAPSSAERDLTITHGLVNIAGNGLFGLSLSQRLGGAHDAAIWPLLAGYLLIGVGGYIGGHVVFKYGYAVNHNAFSRGRRAKEYTAVLPVADLPDGVPTRATLGTTALVLVRCGDVVHALRETCSHAGGPLSEGRVVGDGIECPWHGSVFRLADGSVRHGPATSRQVRYRARIAEGQVEVEGPHG